MSLKLHIIDVGHGDAVLLQWAEPDGPRNVLIDGGAQDKQITAGLARYLESVGATALDLVVVVRQPPEEKQYRAEENA